MSRAAVADGVWRHTLAWRYWRTWLQEWQSQRSERELQLALKQRVHLGIQRWALGQWRHCILPVIFVSQTALVHSTPSTIYSPLLSELFALFLSKVKISRF